jgi:diguanylate cyclase (GGDEF)-like protein
LSNPRLSSVSQNIYGQGFKAGELAIDILEGKKVEKNKIVELDILYRQSCGCVPKTTFEPMYIDKFGREQVEGSLEGLNNSYSDTIQEKYNIISFMDIVKSSNTIRQFYYDLPYIIDNINMENIQIVFYKEPVFLDPEEDFCVPENAELKMFYDSKTKNKKMLDDEIFNPSKILFSEKYLSDTKGVYIIQPIFSGEISYGYCICKINTKKFVDYGVHLKIFINAISQAYEYTHQLLLTEKLKSENLDLNAVSRTDELTKILNRRGFKELGQRAIDLAQEKLQPVVVFFGDMDGLKTINDTYGHEMGDKAIKLQAKVLSKAFRTDDIVGRLSGDEFGIIAVGMGVERIDDVKEKVAALNEQISKENDLPFTLSISLGGVDLQSSSNLKRLLSEADKKLYVEKQIKHAKRR